MNWQEFALNPADYGLPSQQQLKDLRIWSDHYHGLWNMKGLFTPLQQHEEMLLYVKRLGIEKVISLDIAGDDDTEALKPSPIEDEERKLLENGKDHILGIVRVDAEFPDESCAKMEKWIRNGPCIGIKFLLQKNDYKCSHPNSDKIIRLAHELGAASIFTRGSKRVEIQNLFTAQILREKQRPWTLRYLQSAFQMYQ